MRFRSALRLPLLLAAFFGSGCSVKQLAVNQLGDALSGGGEVFASDDDPELVGDALPFSLKLMESILAESPEHEGLLASLASGFTQYAYGWVQLEADLLEDENYTRSVELRERAVNLYRRARDYGLRGLEARYPGFGAGLKADAETALLRLAPEDVELLYWTGMAWAGAISLSLDDMNWVGDLAYAEAMLERALELDPDWGDGAIHEFFITYEMSRMNSEGDPARNATRHYRRALEASEGQVASIHVAYAESVAVEQQDKELFLEVLNRALVIDVDRRPSLRVMNLLYQKRAKWLLTRLDWLFL